MGCADIESVFGIFGTGSRAKRGCQYSPQEGIVGFQPVFKVRGAENWLEAKKKMSALSDKNL